MDEKLKIKLLAFTKAQIRMIWEDEGISMHDTTINQTILDDGCELQDLFSPYLSNEDDDAEYDRLQSECLKVVEEEFNRIMAEIKEAYSIIQITLGV